MSDAGVEPYQAEELRRRGVDLPTASQLRRLGLTYRHLDFARAAGLPVESAAVGRSVGFDLDRYRRLVRLGLADDQISALAAGDLEAVERLSDLGVPLTVTLEWHRQGHDLGRCTTEVTHGTPLDSVPEELAWKRTFQRSTSRRAWRVTPLTVDEASAAAAGGRRPIDILINPDRKADGRSRPRARVTHVDGDRQLDAEPPLPDLLSPPSGPAPASTCSAL